MTDLVEAARIINQAADELKRFNDMTMPGRKIAEVIGYSRLDPDSLATIIEACAAKLGTMPVPEFEDVMYDLFDVHKFFQDRIAKYERRFYEESSIPRIHEVAREKDLEKRW